MIRKSVQRFSEKIMPQMARDVCRLMLMQRWRALVAIHGRAMLFDAHANAARHFRRFVVPALAAAIAGFASSAALAQCTAQDFLKHQLDPGRRMAGAAQPVIRAGRDIDTWKT